MADNVEEEDFGQFKRIAADLIMRHPNINHGFDLNLALWIGDTVFTKYQVEMLKKILNIRCDLNLKHYIGKHNIVILN